VQGVVGGDARLLLSPLSEVRDVAEPQGATTIAEGERRACRMKSSNESVRGQAMPMTIGNRTAIRPSHSCRGARHYLVEAARLISDRFGAEQAVQQGASLRQVSSFTDT